MNEKEIELIDGFFNKGWCCDLDEVYKAVMKLQNNWNKLKEFVNTGYYDSYMYSSTIIKKMQELEGNNDSKRDV